jgi:hypothetical protein
MRGTGSNSFGFCPFARRHRQQPAAATNDTAKFAPEYRANASIFDIPPPLRPDCTDRKVDGNNHWMKRRQHQQNPPSALPPNWSLLTETWIDINTILRVFGTMSAWLTSLILLGLRNSRSTSTVPLLTSVLSTAVLSGTFVAVFAYASLSHRDRRLAFVLHFKRNRRAIAVLLVVSCLHARLLRLLTSSFGGSKAFRAPLSAASRLAISSFSAAATVTFDLVHVFFLVRRS